MQLEKEPSRPERAGIRGIVLDAVGTLITTVPSVAVAYTAAATRQGIKLDAERVGARLRTAFARDDGASSLRTDEASEAARWQRVVATVLPEAPDPVRAFQELWDHFGSPGAWKLYPEAVEALRIWAGAGLSVRVASNFDSRLRGVLAGLPGAGELAETVLIATEIGWRKPSPVFFQAACRALGLPPGAVLAVGDEPENDLYAPRRAGLRSVLIDRTPASPGPSASVPDLTLLAEWVVGGSDWRTATVPTDI